MSDTTDIDNTEQGSKVTVHQLKYMLFSIQVAAMNALDEGFVPHGDYNTVLSSLFSRIIIGHSRSATLPSGGTVTVKFPSLPYVLQADVNGRLRPVYNSSISPSDVAKPEDVEITLNGEPLINKLITLDLFKSLVALADIAMPEYKMPSVNSVFIHSIIPEYIGTAGSTAAISSTNCTTCVASCKTYCGGGCTNSCSGSGTCGGCDTRCQGCSGWGACTPCTGTCGNSCGARCNGCANSCGGGCSNCTGNCTTLTAGN